MKKIYRSRKNKILAGICGGLGNYWDIDPIIIRIFLVILALFTGIFPVVIAYIIACWIIPIEPKSSPSHCKYKRLYRSRTNRKFAGILGGLSKIFQVDATLLRLLYVFLAFLTGLLPLIIIYIIGWIVIPEEPIEIKR